MTPSRSEARRRARPARAIAVAAIAGWVLPVAAAHAEVVVNEDQFRDWIGRCETDTTTGQVVCFIYTGRVAEVEGEELAARVVVGIGDSLQPIVYLDVPDTAEPATGFMLQVDNQEPFSGRFISCATGWCHTEAAGEVAQVLVQQFRGGSQATASFVLEEQDARVDLPLSLLGFTAAYAQLLAIHEEAARLSAEDVVDEPAGAEAEEPDGAADDEPSTDGEPAAQETDAEAPADAADETESAAGRTVPADDQPPAQPEPDGDQAAE